MAKKKIPVEVRQVRCVVRDGEILGPWVSSESRKEPNKIRPKHITHINYRDENGEIQSTKVGIYVNILNFPEGDNWWSKV